MNPEERPLDKRGALLASNPEEMMHTVLFAIARDIDTGAPTEILEQWRARVLSCTGAFMIHANEAARAQAAMQLRENMANDHETMNRTQLKHVYEIIYPRNCTPALMAGFRQALPTSRPSTPRRAWPRVGKRSPSRSSTPR